MFRASSYSSSGAKITAVAASGLSLERGGSSVVGRSRTDHDQRSNGKPEAATAGDKLLMMGMRMPETCWAVFKRQAINLGHWCIWLVDLNIWWCTDIQTPFYLFIQNSLMHTHTKIICMILLEHDDQLVKLFSCSMEPETSLLYKKHMAADTNMNSLHTNTSYLF